jgi:serine/threonine protein kinase
MAPEVLAVGGSEEKAYSFSADIYSMGVIIFKLLEGKFPYE